MAQCAPRIAASCEGGTAILSLWRPLASSALAPGTPLRVRGMLLAAIAYFILPFDFVPDIIAGLGFADDAALVTAVVALVSAHITPTHRAAAARALDKELPKTT